MVAAQQLPAVAALQREAGIRIHLQDVDAAGVGAVHHPEPALLVEEHTGVYRVGLYGGIIDTAVLVRRGGVLPGFQDDPQILIRALHIVRHRYP